MMFAGLNIQTSVYLTEAGDPITVRRTWRERWCSRPWRPWRTTKVVIPQVPSKRAHLINPYTIVIHPAMLDTLPTVLSPLDPARTTPKEKS